MTYTQSNILNTRTTPSSKTLGLHRDSQSISKIQPKIRIIHIIAPEIINTDVANFRDLVQRLTGKATAGGQRRGRGKVEKKMMAEVVDVATTRVTKNEDLYVVGPTSTAGSSSSLSTSSNNYENENHGFWVDHANTTSGGFLSEFTDSDVHGLDLSLFNYEDFL